ncbi:hypothetical protein [Halomonas lysinitropha]|uniref:hypothetical protein n=1 Tax=Halomonas lysinitropha TaxID=2607506 RepID=UPI001CEC4AEB|nr:hypothetical protein [Halomonas lysinitropha]
MLPGRRLRLLAFGLPSSGVPRDWAAGDARPEGKFQGEEALLRERGVEVEVLQDPECIPLMEGFIAASPELWHEDIGE